jgi:integrase
MLVVKPSGARSWVLRYQIHGRRRDMGLGSFPEVTLAMARERALEARRQIAEGRDPLNDRATSKPLTFSEAANALIAAKRKSWRNAKHAAQWTSTLERYVLPSLGDRDVRAIETNDVLAVLNPIWTKKPETASRVRQRIEAVLDYATAIGKREGANPARWRGHLDQVLAQPNKVRAVAHFAAMDWREVPGFMASLGECSGIGAQALAFAILTAARSGEVLGATWSEFDLEQGVWTVPAARMKAGTSRQSMAGKWATARTLFGCART